MGFLLIFDLTNEKSFLEVQDWIEQLKTHAYCDTPDVILCGNKSDLENSRVVSEERVRNFAEKFNMPYVETSACTGQNVKRAVDILLEKVMNRMEVAVDKAKLPGRRGRPKRFDEPEATTKLSVVLEETDKKPCSC